MPSSSTPGSLLVGREWFDDARALRETDAVFDAMVAELQRRCNELMDPGAPRYLDPGGRESPWWKSRMGGKQLVVAAWDLAMAARS